MIRWGAIAAFLWAGAASAQGMPADPVDLGCGAQAVVAVEAGEAPRQHRPKPARAGIDSSDAGGEDGGMVPKFTRFDRQMVCADVCDARFALCLRARPALAGLFAYDLAVEAEQSRAADPQV